MYQKKDTILRLVVSVLVVIAFVVGARFIINKPIENSMENVGKIAKKGDMLSVNYTGRLEDGTVFDSNVDPRFNHVEPFVFMLGGGQVIRGWDNGFEGMAVGEKKTLVIGPEDAYGENGIPPVIPPNATLIFEVELIDIR